MTNFNDFLNEQLQDEEVKKEYDALDEEFKKIQKEIDIRMKSKSHSNN